MKPRIHRKWKMVILFAVGLACYEFIPVQPIPVGIFFVSGLVGIVCVLLLNRAVEWYDDQVHAPCNTVEAEF